MNFTFGIITHKDSGNDVTRVLHSIIQDGCKAHAYIQLIVIGGKYLNDPRLTYVPFDETIKNGWITKKKNIVTQLAQYENIVYMHDYIELMPGWFEGFNRFGDNWNVCMNPIQDQDGNRFRDWVAWDDPEFGSPGLIKEKWCPPEGLPTTGSMTPVPYSYNKTEHMYVSGAYFVAKQTFMKSCPLNEDLVWGEGEDVEWSYRARENWIYRMNPLSTVRFNKAK